MKDEKNNQIEINKTKNIKKIDGIFSYKHQKSIIPDQYVAVEKTEDLIINNKTRIRPSYVKILIYTLSLIIFSLGPYKTYIFAKEAQNQSHHIKNSIQEAYSLISEKRYDEAYSRISKTHSEIQDIKQEYIASGQQNIYINNNTILKDPFSESELYIDIADNALYLFMECFEEIKQINDFQISSVFDRNKDNSILIDNIRSISNKINNNQEKISKIQDAVRKIEKPQDNNLTAKINSLSENIHMLDAIPEILGDSYDKKYLLLFQNNTELRPTGGFIGSYGIITIRKGVIKDIFIDSIYNPDGQLTKKIDPPEQLKKITPYLAMRDANWDPNFPNSAKLISDLYEMEGGFTPDGIISIDTNLIIELLKITGPIDIPEHNTTISSENFTKITQFKTSIDFDATQNNPKKFLADFSPLLFQSISQLDNSRQKEVGRTIFNLTQSRNIQLYSPVKDIQKTLHSLKLDGGILPVENDYSMIVDANIGGMKTNNEISGNINHDIYLENQKARHKITIQRQHQGSYNWPSGKYFGYIRFYTPQDSQINSITGLYESDSIIKSQNNMLSLSDNPVYLTNQTTEIYEDYEKRIFGGWITQEPGDHSTLEIEYTTKVHLPYELYIQKQSGSPSYPYTINIYNKSKSGYNLIKSLETVLNQDIIVKP